MDSEDIKAPEGTSTGDIWVPTKYDWPVIAVDGGAGTGTSSLVKGLSSWTGWPGVNTGSMYRGLAWYSDRLGISVHDTTALIEMANTVQFEFNGTSVSSVNGDSVTEHELSLQSGRVEHIGSIGELRMPIRVIQRGFAARGACIVEGRDIGTVVLPGAQLMIYLTCDPAERARRRTDKEKRLVTAEDIIERDRVDAEREHCPMVAAEGAITLDTTETSELLLQLAVRVLLKGHPDIAPALRGVPL